MTSHTGKRKNKIMTKKNQKRYGIYYISHGKLTGPYLGHSFTKYSIGQKRVKDYISGLKNYILKSRVEMLPVK